MQILSEGKKELIGKVFFKCEECECEFIADEGEWESYLVTSPNIAVIDCPICGNDLRTHIDEGHREALFYLRKLDAKKKATSTIIDNMEVR